MLYKKKQHQKLVLPERLFVLFFLFFIFISALLPSGYVLFFPIKYIALFLLCVSFVFLAVMCRVFNRESFSYLGLFSLIVFYVVLGVFNEFEMISVLTEFFAILSFFIILFFAHILTNIMPPREALINVLKYSVYGSFLFVLVKSILFTALILGWVDYDYVVNKIFPWINYEPVGLGIEGGGSRFSFVTLDFISVCIIFFYFFYKSSYDGVITSKVFTLLYIFLFCVSIFSAYSRALFLIIPFFVLTFAVLKRDFRLIFFVFIVLFLIFMNNVDYVMSVYEQRFVGQEHSDSWRLLMVNKMLEYWSGSPIIGYGIGSYIPDFVRDPTKPYSYEVQLLSMFFKFGGVLFFLFAFIFFKFACLRGSREGFLAQFILIVWMVLSFTNQYLFNTTVAVLGVILYLIYKSLPKRVICFT